ncbi:MAG: 2-phosphosulfolactate phosphatase [Gemmatimonadota bacterium]
MRLDVWFSPLGLTPGEVQGRTVLVIDILRAGTAMCAALHNGARAVLPVASTEEALRLAQTLGTADVLLAGERNCLRIDGFALGNSPLEMTPEIVRNKNIIMTTTNGTPALIATQGAQAVYPAVAANLTRAGRRAAEVWERDHDLLILCAGRENRFSLDDAYCAGRLAVEALGGHKRRKGLNDAALASLDLVRRYGTRFERPLRFSSGGQRLESLGFGADIEESSRVDAYPALLTYHERRVIASPVTP